MGKLLSKQRTKTVFQFLSTTFADDSKDVRQAMLQCGLDIINSQAALSAELLPFFEQGLFLFLFIYLCYLFILFYLFIYSLFYLIYRSQTNIKVNRTRQTKRSLCNFHGKHSKTLTKRRYE
jgi:hypothetical protein